MADPTITVGRLILGRPPQIWNEQIGDPIGSIGGAIVPAQRTPLSFQVALATWLRTDDTLATAQKLRRQLRSMLNNTPLKLQSYLYVTYSDDTEFNGWYVPNQASIQGLDNTSWLAVGLWSYQNAAWSLAGHLRTHREARKVWMKGLTSTNVATTPAYTSDYLGSLIITDFSIYSSTGASPLGLTYLPNGISGVANSVNGQGYLPNVTPGTDTAGFQTNILANLTDLTVVAWERPDSLMNGGSTIFPGDVIAYDRRGGYQIQTGMVRADGSYQLLASDLGCIEELVGGTVTLPRGLATGLEMADGPLSWIVKNATTGTITVSTGTTGVIDNYSGGINATSTTVVAGESLIFTPASNLYDWISI